LEDREPVVKRLKDLRCFTAPDGSHLAEVLHPHREELPGDGAFSLSWASVPPGGATLPHLLEGRTETYWYLEGSGAMTVGESRISVEAGTAVLVPPGTVQWVENPGPGTLAFLCLVSPPWTEESDRRA
jgi:mannose-6-phosphate isomerase-like protein (cupin superfamily)